MTPLLIGMSLLLAVTTAAAGVLATRPSQALSISILAAGLVSLLA